MNSKELVKSLRAIADFYEKNPDVPVPYTNSMNAYVSTADDLIKVAKKLAKCEKGATNFVFYLRKVFGSITLDFNLSRGAVCTRRVVGQRTVPATVIPERVEDVVEWDCQPLLSKQQQEVLGVGSSNGDIDETNRPPNS